ncbi:MAG: DMT family transporter [Planctomycetota bacterium]|nr:DMT family transporter [Planctomycetota bacterium]
MHRSPLRADLILLLVAAIWGSGFIAQRVASRSMGPLTFNAIRYLVGFALLGVLLASLRRWKPNRTELIGGFWLGLVMAGAAWLQQHGIEFTTAARAGFFTGLYVLLVPVAGLLFGQRPRAAHVIGATVAVAGLWLLSREFGSDLPNGEPTGGLLPGDPYIIACAVLWAFHVALTGKLAPTADPLRLAAVQFAVVAVLSGVIALPLEASRFVPESAGLLALCYSGVLVIAVAFTLQIVAQRDAPPTHAAVLMSLEAVFAAVLGILLLGERLTPIEYAGCGLMLAGMLLSQLLPHKRTQAEIAELTDPVR